MRASGHTTYMNKQSCSEASHTTSANRQEVDPLFHRAKSYPLTVYFDGECPICRREIHLIKVFNRRECLQFIDFSTSAYRPTDHGLNQGDLGRVIHDRWSDGSIITGVEAFTEMWEAIGFGVLARLSRLPLINALLVKAYTWFAKNRLRLTGRKE